MGKILYFKGDTTPYYKYVGLLINSTDTGVAPNNYLEISYDVYAGGSTTEPLYSGTFKLTNTQQLVAITVPKNYSTIQFTDVNYENNATVYPYRIKEGHESTVTPLPLQSIFDELSSSSLTIFDNKSDALSTGVPTKLYEIQLTTVQPCYFGLTFDLSNQDNISVAYRDPNSIDLYFRTDLDTQNIIPPNVQPNDKITLTKNKELSINGKIFYTGYCYYPITDKDALGIQSDDDERYVTLNPSLFWFSDFTINKDGNTMRPGNFINDYNPFGFTWSWKGQSLEGHIGTAIPSELITKGYYANKLYYNTDNPFKIAVVSSSLSPIPSVHPTTSAIPSGSPIPSTVPPTTMQPTNTTLSPKKSISKSK